MRLQGAGGEKGGWWLSLSEAPVGFRSVIAGASPRLGSDLRCTGQHAGKGLAPFRGLATRPALELAIAQGYAKSKDMLAERPVSGVADALDLAVLGWQREESR